MGGNSGGLSLSLFFHVTSICWTGFLLGYDLCIAGVILTPVQRSLEMCYPCSGGITDAALAACSCTEKQFAVSSVSIGGAFGALFGGILADIIGRRAALLLSDVCFAAGAAAMAFAHINKNYMFYFGRISVGIALGLGGAASSAYLAEIAPPNMRGRFLLANELFICCGCLAAFIVGYLLGDNRWRLSIGITCLVTILQFISILFMVESPRWLLTCGSYNKALHASFILNGELGKESVQALVCTIAEDKNEPENNSGRNILPSSNKTSKEQTSLMILKVDSSSCHMYVPRTFNQTCHSLWRARKPLLLAFGIATAHSATAANTVLYYSRDVLQLAGIKKPLLADLAVGCIKFLGVLVALLIADKVGRRRLLLFGTTLMVISLAGLSFGFAELLGSFSSSGPLSLQDNNDGHLIETRLVVISLLCFILGWDLSWAGLMLALISEVLPQDVRATGCGAAYALYWMLSFVTSQFFESSFAAFGIGTTFSMLCALSSCVLLWTWYNIPETANSTLEAITERVMTSSSIGVQTLNDLSVSSDKSSPQTKVQYSQVL